MATRERTGFVDVDALQQQVTVQQVCDFYAVDPGELRQTGTEIRTRCFLVCGKNEPTGDRALAIDVQGPKRWKCYQSGCGKSGNLVGMCDYLKPGPHRDGRPRGQRFREIAADLQAIARFWKRTSACQRARLS